jgi:hypothetical protein
MSLVVSNFLTKMCNSLPYPQNQINGRDKKLDKHLTDVFFLD